jgi:glycolate oxidase FAD binding subunit
MPGTDKLVSKLRGMTGEAHVIRDPDQLKAHALDGKRPKVIVSPGTIDEVSQVVSFANQDHLAIVTKGGGTKMGMGGIPKKMDILLSTARLNRVVDCDTDNLTLSVESGISLNDVQKRLAGEGRGYFLPLDPPFSERATLGGIVATNSSGPRRFLYGTSRDLITGIKAVFPNGDIVVSGGKTVKNVSGYDLCKLLIGCFGTLGIITEITFKLLPLPESEATLLVPFQSLEGADHFAQEITHSQLLPASVEIMNGRAAGRIEGHESVSSNGNYLVAIGLEGVAESIDRQISEMIEKGRKQGSLEAMTLDSEKHRKFWMTLRNLPERLMKEYRSFILLKSNFLISRSGEMLQNYEKLSQELGVDCAMTCHSGNGILYTYIVGRNVRTKSESLVKLIGKLTAEAVKNEGNLVVEASPVSVKRKVDVWGQPRADQRIMHSIKERIDPAGVLNPGRFVGGI